LIEYTPWFLIKAALMPSLLSSVGACTFTPTTSQYCMWCPITNKLNYWYASLM